jgi:predicted acyl esterase
VGHKIRIQVSGAFFPHFSRNLQSGEPEVTASATCVAHVRIYNDAEHRSRIELPIHSR